MDKQTEGQKYTICCSFLTDVIKKVSTGFFGDTVTNISLIYSWLCNHALWLTDLYIFCLFSKVQFLAKFGEFWAHKSIDVNGKLKLSSNSGKLFFWPWPYNTLLIRCLLYPIKPCHTKIGTYCLGIKKVWSGNENNDRQIA